MSNPLFYNLFTDEYSYPAYKKSGSSLVRSKDQFNFGYRVSLGYAFKRNIAFSIEVGQDKSSIYPYKDNYYYDDMGYYYSMEFTHEMIDLNTFVIVPKFEFGNANSLLPLGLTHQAGFGVSFTSIQEKDYVYRMTDSYSTSSGYTNYSKNTVDPVDIDKFGALRKFIIMYAINMRSPITKNLLVSYGLKYTLNVGKSYSYPTNANQYMDIDYIIDEMNRQRKLSFITLNVGLTYAF
jgi:hypothetical protein